MHTFMVGGTSFARQATNGGRHRLGKNRPPDLQRTLVPGGIVMTACTQSRYSNGILAVLVTFGLGLLSVAGQVAARAVLTRRESEPGTELPATFKDLGIRNGRGERTRCDRPNTKEISTALC